MLGFQVVNATCFKSVQWLKLIQTFWSAKFITASGQLWLFCVTQSHGSPLTRHMLIKQQNLTFWPTYNCLKPTKAFSCLYHLWKWLELQLMLDASTWHIYLMGCATLKEIEREGGARERHLTSLKIKLDKDAWSLHAFKHGDHGWIRDIYCLSLKEELSVKNG